MNRSPRNPNSHSTPCSSSDTATIDAHRTPRIPATTNIADISMSTVITPSRRCRSIFCRCSRYGASVVQFAPRTYGTPRPSASPTSSSASVSSGTAGTCRGA